MENERASAAHAFREQQNAELEKLRINLEFSQQKEQQVNDELEKLNACYATVSFRFYFAKEKWNERFFSHKFFFWIFNYFKFMIKINEWLVKNFNVFLWDVIFYQKSFKDSHLNFFQLKEQAEKLKNLVDNSVGIEEMRMAKLKTEEAVAKAREAEMKINRLEEYNNMLKEEKDKREKFVFPALLKQQGKCTDLDETYQENRNWRKFSILHFRSQIYLHLSQANLLVSHTKYK